MQLIIGHSKIQLGRLNIITSSDGSFWPKDEKIQSIKLLNIQPMCKSPQDAIDLADHTYEIYEQNKTDDIHTIIFSNSDYFYKQLQNHFLEAYCLLKNPKLIDAINKKVKIYDFTKDKTIAYHILELGDDSLVPECDGPFDKVTNQINAKYYEIIDKLHEKEE